MANRKVPSRSSFIDAIVAKLGITRDGLYKRAKRLRNQIPMTVEESINLIAFQEGIKIDRFLEPDAVAQTRQLHTHFVQANGPISSKPQARRDNRNGAPAASKEIRFSGNLRIGNALLPTAKLHEAKAMAEIYPFFYILENSMRELISRVMAASFGSDWWDTQLSKGKLKGIHSKVADRMRTEHKNSWHQKRGSHPIDYTDIKDLASIILAKQDNFIPMIIRDREWFIQFMKELEPSRNVVCHMNPLDGHNIADVKLKVRRWDNLISAARDDIPD